MARPRRTLASITAAGLAAGLAVSSPASADRSPTVRISKAAAVGGALEAAVPGELIVSFEPGRRPAARAAAHAAIGATVLNRLPGLDVHVVRVPPGRTVAETAREYERRPEVDVAEPNWHRSATVIPNDPRFSDLWGLDNTGQLHPIADPPPARRRGTAGSDINAPEAWDQETGDPEVVIAVIDTGIALEHPDLAPNIWVNAGEIPGNGIDDDVNGYIDDVNGWDVIDDDNLPTGGSHGSHVAGTIAAATNNGIGVSGICGGFGAADPGCSIMPIRFLDDDGFGDLGGELEAIEYAIDNDADVINASFGGGEWSELERDAFAAAGEAGILSVAAAGNDSLDNDMALFTGFGGSPAYPASYNLPEILSVAASNHHDRYAYDTGCVEHDGRSRAQCAFSNFGRYSVDIAAPGVDVTSTVPPDGYETWNGTSMAAPHVSGVAGLILSMDQDATPEETKNRILNGADRDVPLNRTMHTALFRRPQRGAFTRTNGRLDADAAMGAAETGGTGLHDGDIPGARPMARIARGRVAWPGDVNDVYRKLLRRGETYEVTLGVPQRKDYDLYVLRPSAVEIWEWPSTIRQSFRPRGRDEIVRLSPGSDRRYFLHVSSWFSTGKYTLRVRCLTC
jgi:subtilisin family serine protease